MVDRQRLQTVLRAFPHTLVRRYDVGHVLYQLSDDVTAVLEVTGSGVSLLEEDTLRFVSATSEQVEHVERLQDHFGEGSCEHAASTASPMVVDDLRMERDRWPKFAPAAADHGLFAVLASRCTSRAPPSARSASTPTNRAPGQTRS
ncbi:MAG: GAF domain-containing protein [Actinobacteria bacterium]|nr:GAF domain-containing protein [Actinomycetota bacterium]